MKYEEAAERMHAAFILYLQAADNFAKVSASKKLTQATIDSAEASLRSAQREYFDAVDAV